MAQIDKKKRNFISVTTLSLATHAKGIGLTFQPPKNSFQVQNRCTGRWINYDNATKKFVLSENDKPSSHITVGQRFGSACTPISQETANLAEKAVLTILNQSADE